MAIEHAVIPEIHLHEPKGASTAVLDTVYISDGAGSGAWGTNLRAVGDIVIDRLIDGLSTAVSQEPTGLDTPLQIEFGPAQGTGGDPVMLSNTGELTFNEAGTYRLKISIAVGRTGGAGVSELYARVASGGVQLGQSVHFKIGGSDTYVPFSDTAWIVVGAGTVIDYEILRDSTGADAGGLFQGDPNTAGWNTNPCAAIRVERWIEA